MRIRPNQHKDIPLGQVITGNQSDPNGSIGQLMNIRNKIEIPNTEFADKTNPTDNEVRTWVDANLTDLQKVNSQLIVQEDNEGIEKPRHVWDIINDSITKLNRYKNLFSNYDDLRSTLGVDADDVIVIKDFTYIFQSNTYTTRGGVFYKDTTGTENGGTVIVANDGTIWKRDYPMGQHKPEWWEVGGYDLNGNVYVDENTATLNSKTRDGIAFESERIQAAMNMQGTLLLEDRVYVVDTEVEVPTNLIIEGNNATIKRADVVQTVLTGTPTSNAGTGIIPVVSTAGWHVGMSVGILDVSTASGGIGYGDNSQILTGAVLVVTKVNATSLETVNGNALVNNHTFVAGDIVIKRFSTIGNTSMPYENLTMRDLTIDGNRDNNDVINDWTWFHDFSPGDASGMLLVERCKFINGQTTMAFPNKGHFSYCEFRDINGGGVHIGSTLETGIWFDHCNFYDTVERDAGEAQHTEGAIVWSVGVAPITITNCEIINCGASAFGNSVINNSDRKITITGNYAENCASIFSHNSGTTDIEIGEFYMTDNFIRNCGDMAFEGRVVQQGFSFNRAIIDNNWIINGRAVFSQISHVYLTNNKFITDETDPNYTTWTSASTGQEAFVQFTGYDEITISGNTFAGPQVNNDFVRNGLLMVSNPATTVKRKDAAGVDTDIMYPQKIKINDNTFYNFTTSISGNTNNNSTLLYDEMVVGWEIQRNTVFMTRDVISNANTIGITAPPGTYIHNNTVYMPNGGRAGIHVQGIRTDGGKEDTLQGSIATNNRVYSTTNAFLIGYAGSTQFIGNMIFKDNIYMGNVFDTRAVSYVDIGNIEINTAAFPEMTIPTVPTYQNWKENAAQY